jgi:predicted acylesterase/phospholipase RssA
MDFSSVQVEDCDAKEGLPAARVKSRCVREKEFSMSRFIVLVLVSAATICLPVGCQSIRQYPPVPAKLQSVERGPVQGSNDDSVRHVDHEDWNGEERARRPENILVLSGGGINGAFSAGMLVGWTRSGSRPEFDIVTGVSTGALIAPLAFLGTDYDAELKRLYTSESATRIYDMLPLFLWSNAVASSKPLDTQIRSVITQDLLDRIAVEHRQGRRLYIGTTNLDTQRPVVWDIGAIAAGHAPGMVKLVQDVILASCSVPGLLPPIEINVEINGKRYSELHVDGGVGASMFLPPQSLKPPSLNSFTPVGATSERTRPTTVYTIVAGKADPDPVPVKQGLLQLSGASLSGVLRAQQEHDLMRIYLLTYFANARFQLAAIPQEYTAPASSLEFDLKTMRALFDEGQRQGSSSAGWIDTPPGIDPKSWTNPRTGTRLDSHSLSSSAVSGDRP